jgi:hypothetical protein
MLASSVELKLDAYALWRSTGWRRSVHDALADSPVAGLQALATQETHFA